MLLDETTQTSREFVRFRSTDAIFDEVWNQEWDDRRRYIYGYTVATDIMLNNDIEPRSVDECST